MYVYVWVDGSTGRAGKRQKEQRSKYVCVCVCGFVLVFARAGSMGVRVGVDVDRCGSRGDVDAVGFLTCHSECATCQSSLGNRFVW